MAKIEERNSNIGEKTHALDHVKLSLPVVSRESLKAIGKKAEKSSNPDDREVVEFINKEKNLEKVYASVEKSRDSYKEEILKTLTDVLSPNSDLTKYMHVPDLPTLGKPTFGDSLILPRLENRKEMSSALVISINPDQSLDFNIRGILPGEPHLSPFTFTGNSRDIAKPEKIIICYREKVLELPIPGATKDPLLNLPPDWRGFERTLNEFLNDETMNSRFPKLGELGAYNRTQLTPSIELEYRKWQNEKADELCRFKSSRLESIGEWLKEFSEGSAPQIEKKEGEEGLLGIFQIGLRQREIAKLHTELFMLKEDLETHYRGEYEACRKKLEIEPDEGEKKKLLKDLSMKLRMEEFGEHEAGRKIEEEIGKRFKREQEEKLGLLKENYREMFQLLGSLSEDPGVGLKQMAEGIELELEKIEHGKLASGFNYNISSKGIDNAYDDYFCTQFRTRETFRESVVDAALRSLTKEFQDLHVKQAEEAASFNVLHLDIRTAGMGDYDRLISAVKKLESEFPEFNINAEGFISEQNRVYQSSTIYKWIKNQNSSIRDMEEVVSKALELNQNQIGEEEVRKLYYGAITEYVTKELAKASSELGYFSEARRRLAGVGESELQGIDLNSKVEGLKERISSLQKEIRGVYGKETKFYDERKYAEIYRASFEYGREAFIEGSDASGRQARIDHAEKLKTFLGRASATGEGFLKALVKAEEAVEWAVIGSVLRMSENPIQYWGSGSSGDSGVTARYMDARRRFGNKHLGVSILGTDTELAGMDNLSMYLVSLSASFGTASDLTVKPLFELVDLGVDATLYGFYKMGREGLSEKEFHELLKTDEGLQWVKTGVHVAEIGASLYIATQTGGASLVGQASRSKQMMRMLGTTTGFGFAQTLGEHLLRYEEIDPALFLRDLIKNTSHSAMFIGAASKIQSLTSRSALDFMDGLSDVVESIDLRSLMPDYKPGQSFLEYVLENQRQVAGYVVMLGVSTMDVADVNMALGFGGNIKGGLTGDLQIDMERSLQGVLERVEEEIRSGHVTEEEGVVFFREYVKSLAVGKLAERLEDTTDTLGRTEVPLETLTVNGVEFRGYYSGNRKAFYLTEQVYISELYKELAIERGESAESAKLKSEGVVAFYDQRQGVIFSAQSKPGETELETRIRTAYLRHEYIHSKQENPTSLGAELETVEAELKYLYDNGYAIRESLSGRAVVKVGDMISAAVADQSEILSFEEALVAKKERVRQLRTEDGFIPELAAAREKEKGQNFDPESLSVREKQDVEQQDPLRGTKPYILDRIEELKKTANGLTAFQELYTELSSEFLERAEKSNLSGLEKGRYLFSVGQVIREGGVDWLYSKKSEEQIKYIEALEARVDDEQSQTLASHLRNRNFPTSSSLGNTMLGLFPAKLTNTRYLKEEDGDIIEVLGSVAKNSSDPKTIDSGNFVISQSAITANTYALKITDAIDLSRHVVLQQAYESCVDTVILMRVLDVIDRYKININEDKYKELLSEISNGGRAYENFAENQLKEVLEGTGLEVKVITDVKEDPEFIHDKIEKYGYAIASVDGHAIIIDEVENPAAGKNAILTVRDPFHGWQVKTSFESFMRNYERISKLIHIAPSSIIETFDKNSPQTPRAVSDNRKLFNRNPNQSELARINEKISKLNIVYLESLEEVGKKFAELHGSDLAVKGGNDTIAFYDRDSDIVYMPVPGTLVKKVDGREDSRPKRDQRILEASFLFHEKAHRELSDLAENGLSFIKEEIAAYQAQARYLAERGFQMVFSEDGKTWAIEEKLDKESSDALMREAKKAKEARKSGKEPDFPFALPAKKEIEKFVESNYAARDANYTDKRSTQEKEAKELYSNFAQERGLNVLPRLRDQFVENYHLLRALGYSKEEIGALLKDVNSNSGIANINESIREKIEDRKAKVIREREFTSSSEILSRLEDALNKQELLGIVPELEKDWAQNSLAEINDIIAYAKKAAKEGKYQVDISRLEKHFISICSELIVDPKFRETFNFDNVKKIIDVHGMEGIKYLQSLYLLHLDKVDGTERSFNNLIEKINKGSKTTHGFITEVYVARNLVKDGNYYVHGISVEQIDGKPLKMKNGSKGEIDILVSKIDKSGAETEKIVIEVKSSVVALSDKLKEWISENSLGMIRVNPSSQFPFLESVSQVIADSTNIPASFEVWIGVDRPLNNSEIKYLEEARKSLDEMISAGALLGIPTIKNQNGEILLEVNNEKEPEIIKKETQKRKPVMAAMMPGMEVKQNPDSRFDELESGFFEAVNRDKDSIIMNNAGEIIAIAGEILNQAGVLFQVRSNDVILIEPFGEHPLNKFARKADNKGIEVVYNPEELFSNNASGLYSNLWEQICIPHDAIINSRDNLAPDPVLIHEATHAWTDFWRKNGIDSIFNAIARVDDSDISLREIPGYVEENAKIIADVLKAEGTSAENLGELASNVNLMVMQKYCETLLVNGKLRDDIRFIHDNPQIQNQIRERLEPILVELNQFIQDVNSEKTFSKKDYSRLLQFLNKVRDEYKFSSN